MRIVRFSNGFAEKRLIFQVAKIENLIPENEPLKEGKTDEQNNPEKKDKQKGTETKENGEKDVSVLEETLGNKNKRVDDADTMKKTMDDKITETQIKVQEMKGKTQEELDAKNRDIETDVTAAKDATIIGLLAPDGTPVHSQPDHQLEISQSQGQTMDTKQDAKEVATAAKNEGIQKDRLQTDNVDQSQQEGAKTAA